MKIMYYLCSVDSRLSLTQVKLAGLVLLVPTRFKDSAKVLLFLKCANKIHTFGKKAVPQVPLLLPMVNQMDSTACVEYIPYILD